MEKKKSTGYRIEGAENITVIGNKAIGFEESYVIKDTKNSLFCNNQALSLETIRILIDADKAIKDTEKEIKEKLGDEKLHEIINILNELKKGKPTPPLQIMERMVSLGANTLTIWPVIQTLIHSL